MIKSFILLLAYICIINSGHTQEQENYTDEIFQDYLFQEGPGISIIIIKDDDIVLQDNKGFAEIESTRPIEDDTKFNLGTLTSQFTTMSIMILKDAGELSYKDKVSSYIKEMPDYAKELTIEDLLEESSGLPYFSLQKDGEQYNTPEKTLEFLNKKEELIFEPGKKDAINPVNPALLTLVIEKITGSDYRKFISENIFKPLDMEDSEVFKGGWFYNIKNKTTGYLNSGNNEEESFESVQDIDSKEYMRGVTGIYSTPADMKKWVKAWNEDILIEKGTLSKALRIGFIRGAKEFYGFGWRKGFNNGKKYLYQGGTGYGHTHILLKMPPENIDIIILSNQQSVFGMRKKAFELLNHFSEEEYEVK